MKNYILFSFFLLISYSCSDVVRFDESDLKKHTWLEPFYPNSKYTFLDGYHNLDLGIIEFTYKLQDSKNVLKIIKELDSISVKNHWKVFKTSDHSIFVSKIIPIIPKYDSAIGIQIKSDSTTNTLFFRIQNI